MQCTRSSWGCTQPCLVYLIVGTRLVYIHHVCNEGKAVQVPHISWVQVSAKTETVCVCVPELGSSSTLGQGRGRGKVSRVCLPGACVQVPTIGIGAVQAVC